MDKFIHLHTHTVFTRGNSTLEIEDLLQKCARDGVSATAIVDSGNIDGFEIFTEKCREYGIQPIYGCGFYVADSSRNDESATVSHLVLLVKNPIGIKNLKTLSEISFKEGVVKNKARIDDELIRKYADGLICFTGGLGGDVDKAIATGNLEKAEQRIRFYHEVFGDDFYLELQDHALEKNRQSIEALMDFSEKLNIPTIATQGSFYLNREDAEGCNALRRENGNRELPGTDCYFKTSDEMLALFADYPEALENVQKVAAQLIVSS